MALGLEAATTIANPPPALAEEITWTASPVNKRSGISVFKAEETYNVRFITYLSRFLLSFDDECQKWWYQRAKDIPRTASADQVESKRLSQFGAFSASVEVGLQEYEGAEGPKQLIKLLLDRYGGDLEEVKAAREAKGLAPLKPNEEEMEKREIKEAKRQIALLFSLLKTYQPVEEITALLAAIDNGMVKKVVIENPGGGYAPGYGEPLVTFPPPGGDVDGSKAATGRAVLRPSGRLLRVDISKRGFGYTKPPTVVISPPIAEDFGSPTAKAATAKASLFKDGVNKGRIERIQLTSPGNGYNLDEKIKITISPPELSKEDGGEIPLVKAVMELEVGEIIITNPGSGYAIEKPLEVRVEPPPLTARINLNDPMMAQIISPDKSVSIADVMMSNSKESKAWKMANMKAGGGCIGRECYDQPVIAVAYPMAEADSYKSFRKESDRKGPVMKKERSGKESSPKLKISGVGDEGSAKQVPFWTGGTSTSSTLLSLLPAGIGLIYDKNLNRYDLVAGEKVVDYDWADEGVSPGKPIDPDFGPRGRSPIERQKNLDAGILLRFFAAGALCCSSVHLVLTPIDVVKTQMQADPVKYENPISTYKIVYEEGGVGGIFAGWAPTFIGFFIQGGIVYTCSEFFRRFYTDLLGDIAVNYELPIVLASSFTAAFIGTFVLVVSETIRIRSVAQPDYGSNILEVAQRMIKEEGIMTLFSALPAFLLKEIPFNVTKFTIFAFSTDYLYNAFPAAREDIQLSLLVSLAGGTLGGIGAAVISNPADATISAMKKAKSDAGPISTFQTLVANPDETGGIFRGLGVRMFYYTLIVSLQFLVYDAIRFSLGIGADDLKLYLDVLGGALRESGGPI